MIIKDKFSHRREKKIALSKTKLKELSPLISLFQNSAFKDFMGLLRKRRDILIRELVNSDTVILEDVKIKVKTYDEIFAMVENIKAEFSALTKKMKRREGSNG